jgi:hypothetical protein
MNDIMLRIQRVTDDLKTVEGELNHLLLTKANDRAFSEMLDSFDLETVRGLKAAVDNMRQLLWSYIEALTGENTSDPQLAIHTLRLERATEMLRVLEAPLGSEEMAELARTPQGHSFFSEVGRIASLTVDRYYPKDDHPDSMD